MPRTVTCRYHCASCDEHFASLEAFDHHRRGPYDGERYCELPEICRSDTGRRQLQAKSTRAECRIGGPKTLAGVTVWEATRGAHKQEEPDVQVRRGLEEVPHAAPAPAPVRRLGPRHAVHEALVDGSGSLR